MNVPFTAVQFVVYESGKRALVASHLLDPADGVSLADPATARHLVTTYFLPGFAPGA